MRDPRAQGPAHRRGRRDRPTAIFLATSAKLASVILLQTLALVLWNVGSRDPLALLRDLIGVRDPRRAIYGLASLVIGLMFVAAATVLMISVIGSNPDLFVPFILLTFLVAIAVDALIGDQLRRAVRL